MRSIKIMPPKGYEIDKDKSSFEEIVFKKKNELPKTWKNLNKIEGIFVSSACELRKYSSDKLLDNEKNIFPSERTAKAGGILLPMLLQLRDRYRDGWKPDWNNQYIQKHCINIARDKIDITISIHSQYIFAFQSRKIAQQFLDNFRDMLEEYFNTLTE